MKYVLLALAFMTGSANAADSIVGTWKVTSFTAQWLDTNEVTQPQGENPLGYL